MVLGLKEKIEQDYVSANEAAGMLGVTRNRIGRLCFPMYLKRLYLEERFLRITSLQLKRV